MTTTAKIFVPENLDIEAGDRVLITIFPASGAFFSYEAFSYASAERFLKEEGYVVVDREDRITTLERSEQLPFSLN